MKTVYERFLRKVNLSDECWEWTGAKNWQGYGNAKCHGKSISAHRLAWVIFYGEIPDGLCVLHSCDNPGCVNPKHLFVGTHHDNMLDKTRKGRAARTLPVKRLTREQVKMIKGSDLSVHALSLLFGVSCGSIKRAIKKEQK